MNKFFRQTNNFKANFDQSPYPKTAVAEFFGNRDSITCKGTCLFIYLFSNWLEFHMKHGSFNSAISVVMLFVVPDYGAKYAANKVAHSDYDFISVLHW